MGFKIIRAIADMICKSSMALPDKRRNYTWISKNFIPALSARCADKDAFWKKEMELVRTEVIPYQWAALNDQVEGAAPSYCMHNFKAAGKQNEERREQGKEFREPVYTFRGFETLPEDPAHPEDDKFYGFVFQDSDFYKMD